MDIDYIDGYDIEQSPMYMYDDDELMGDATPQQSEVISVGEGESSEVISVGESPEVISEDDDEPMEDATGQNFANSAGANISNEQIQEMSQYEPMDIDDLSPDANDAEYMRLSPDTEMSREEIDNVLELARDILYPQGMGYINYLKKIKEFYQYCINNPEFCSDDSELADSYRSFKRNNRRRRARRA